MLHCYITYTETYNIFYLSVEGVSDLNEMCFAFHKALNFSNFISLFYILP